MTVVALSLLLSPLWLATARCILPVILLSVTSFRGTVEAMRSPRFVALLGLNRRTREGWRRQHRWQRRLKDSMRREDRPRLAGVRAAFGKRGSVKGAGPDPGS